MTTPNRYQADVLFVGSGISALIAARACREAGMRVLILEQAPATALGGQARDAFGGFWFVDTPEQRKARVRDTRQQAWEDWLGYAEFDEGDHWQRTWAEHYVQDCRQAVRDWLVHQGLSFFPVATWAERAWHGRGNRAPRFHLLWGCGLGLVNHMTQALQHEGRGELSMVCQHRVEQLVREGGRITGVTGLDLEHARPFHAQARHVVISSGGYTGNLARVRQHWPTAVWGPAPEALLNGSYPRIDGRAQDACCAEGAQLAHPEHMWNYAAGVTHWDGEHEGHGLAMIPPRSALWLRYDGARFDPPLLAGADTRELVHRIGTSGHPWSWLLLNRKILERELTLQGATFNPAFREHSWLQLGKELALGHRALAQTFLERCPDVVHAPHLDRLIERMQALTPQVRLNPAAIHGAIQHFDAEIGRGASASTDEQLRYLQVVRQFTGDRLRTCDFQRIGQGGGDLVAVRLRLLSRKSLGGLVTNLDAQVLDNAGEPIGGLYAIGEAAGYGGGGMNGRRTLEGTLLGGCVYSARRLGWALTR